MAEPLILPNPLTGGETRVDRVLLDAGGDPAADAPLLLVLTAVHGNEPSGPLAAAAVAGAVRRGEAAVRGRVVMLACNPPALREDARYLDEDMNRSFDAGRLAGPGDSSELRQLREVVPLIDSLAEGWPGPRFFLDCHSVSSESVPFVSVLSDADCLSLAESVPAHAVVGAGDHLSGVSDRFLRDRGWVGFTFEAGQHHELATLEAQEAMIWTLMQRAGCLAETPARREARLSRVLLDGPRRFRVAEQYLVRHPGRFVMRPGYFNFRRVRAGEVLASDGGKEVRCPRDGRIYMPLYQRLGEVGFTVVEES